VAACYFQGLGGIAAGYRDGEGSHFGRAALPASIVSGALGLFGDFNLNDVATSLFESDERTLFRANLEGGQVRASKARVSKVRVSKVRASKVRALKARVSKVRASKVRALKVRALKVRASKVRALKVRASKVRALKVRALKVRASKVRALKVRALKVRALKVRALKVRADQRLHRQTQQHPIAEPASYLVNRTFGFLLHCHGLAQVLLLSLRPSDASGSTDSGQFVAGVHFTARLSVGFHPFPECLSGKPHTLA
jgi:hypothetical protein